LTPVIGGGDENIIELVEKRANNSFVRAADNITVLLRID
jgi:hypothetical protein